MMYPLANEPLHIKLCSCLGTIGSALPISKGQVDFLLTILVLYLLLGSSLILLSGRSGRPAKSQAAECAASGWGPAHTVKGGSCGQEVVRAQGEPQSPGEAHKSIDFRA